MCYFNYLFIFINHTNSTYQTHSHFPSNISPISPYPFNISSAPSKTTNLFLFYISSDFRKSDKSHVDPKPKKFSFWNNVLRMVFQNYFYSSINNKIQREWNCVTSHFGPCLFYNHCPSKSFLWGEQFVIMKLSSGII